MAGISDEGVHYGYGVQQMHRCRIRHRVGLNIKSTVRDGVGDAETYLVQ